MHPFPKDAMGGEVSVGLRSRRGPRCVSGERALGGSVAAPNISVPVSFLNDCFERVQSSRLDLRVTVHTTHLVLTRRHDPGPLACLSASYILVLGMSHASACCFAVFAHTLR